MQPGVRARQEDFDGRPSWMKLGLSRSLLEFETIKRVRAGQIEQGVEGERQRHTGARDTLTCCSRGGAAQCSQVRSKCAGKESWMVDFVG